MSRCGVCNSNTRHNLTVVPCVALIFRVLRHNRQLLIRGSEVDHHTCWPTAICKHCLSFDSILFESPRDPSLQALLEHGPTPKSATVFMNVMIGLGAKFYDQCYWVEKTQTAGGTDSSFSFDKVVDMQVSTTERRVFIVQTFACAGGLHPRLEEAKHVRTVELLPIFGYDPKDFSLLANPLKKPFQYFCDEKGTNKDARRLHPGIRRAQAFFKRNPTAPSYNEVSDVHTLETENGANGHITTARAGCLTPSKRVYFTTPVQSVWKVVATAEASQATGQMHVILTGDRITHWFLYKPAYDCSFCGQPATCRCTACQEVYYCDVTCQQLHWKAHGNRCAEVQAYSNTPAPWHTCVCGGLCHVSPQADQHFCSTTHASPSQACLSLSTCSCSCACASKLF
jgi:hypothetical protein